MSNWANLNPNQIGENKDVHLMLENGIGCESYFLVQAVMGQMKIQ